MSTIIIGMARIYKHRTRTLLIGTLILAAGSAALSRLNAVSQDEAFSSTELKHLTAMKAKASGPCFGVDALFSGPVKEAPKAVMDIEQMHTIKGMFTKILEAIRIAPDKVRYVVTDPAACETLKASRSKVSITVMDGKGADGHPLFPSERDINR